MGWYVDVTIPYLNRTDELTFVKRTGGYEESSSIGPVGALTITDPSWEELYGYNCYNVWGLTINNDTLKVCKLTGLWGLNTLDLSSNQLEEITLNDMGSLGSLTISNNPGVAFDLTSFEFSLLAFYMSNCGLSTISLGFAPSLSTLYADGNQFTSMDLQYHAQLSYIDIHDNPLTSLTISPAASILVCHDTDLTTLDVSLANTLEYLDASNCLMTTSSMESILSNLVSFGTTNGTCNLQGNATASTAMSASAATLRGSGWTVNI
jgi:hypothetical protein